MTKQKDMTTLMTKLPPADVCKVKRKITEQTAAEHP